MDHIWSPWRYRYLTAEKPPAWDCVFCAMAASTEDEANLIVHRGRTAFVVLNKFPYTSGHVMVVPYRHTAELTALDDAESAEVMALTRTSTAHIQALYRPDGVNLGMNLGEAAGAGVAGHIHMHVLPRWWGDANFMSTIGETRILPEALADTWLKIRDRFALNP